MTSPFFSIVIPAYNVEKFLGKCLESVKNQTFADFECILVDDGSTDESGKICDCFADSDSRFKVIHKINGGVTSARQTALKLSTGVYVVPVDADDWIDVEYLETFRKAIEKNSPDILLCGYRVCSKSGSRERKQCVEAGFYSYEKIASYLHTFFIENYNTLSLEQTLWAKTFRRELLAEEHAFLNPVIKIGEDNAVVIPCLCKCKSIYISDVCMYNYRTNSESAIKSGKPYNWEHLQLRVRHYAQRIDLSEFDYRSQYFRSVTHSVFNCAMTQFYSDKPIACIKKNISENLRFFKEEINRCRFSPCSKGFIAKIVLKYRLYFIMRIFSKHKLREYNR